MAPGLEPALGLRFRVEVDKSVWLGDWSKCEGLTVEYEIHEYKEGGQNGFVHRLPGRAKFPNIKLTRPINSDSARVAKWVADAQKASERRTGSITVLDGAGKPVVVWNFEGLFPARWTGPSLDVSGNQVAMETLELAHAGFSVQGAG